MIYFRARGMLVAMDGHALLGDIGIYSTCVGDGGPRTYRRRGKPLPEAYLPGRFFARLPGAARAAIVRAVNGGAPLAPWFLRAVVDDEEPRVAIPDPPVDRRWSCRGRWSIPPPSVPQRMASSPTGSRSEVPKRA